jgi:hypothetical protein
VKSGRAVFEAYVIGIREMPMNNYRNQDKATDEGRLFLDQPSLERVSTLVLLVLISRNLLWEWMLTTIPNSGLGLGRRLIWRGWGRGRLCYWGRGGVGVGR